MRATIDDVHHRHRQQPRIGAADVAVERQTRRHRRRLGRGERHTEDGIGAELGLVGRTVEFNHHAIEGDLFLGLVAAQRVAQLTVDGIDRLGDTLAHVAIAAVAQFDRFVRAGRSARGNRRPSDRAIVKMHVHLNGGVAAAVENFAADDIDDDGHSGLLWRELLGGCLRIGMPANDIAKPPAMASAS